MDIGLCHDLYAGVATPVVEIRFASIASGGIYMRMLEIANI